MPAIQRSEFSLALNQVAAERGVDPSVVLDTVKNAILAAYRKDHPDTEIEEYEATLDKNTGEAHILHNGTDVTPPGFGRIAAQTAKQVILQKIREKEKEAIITDFRVKIGQVVNGMVLRFAGPNIIVDINKAEGIMPPQEQIPNERYHLNQRLSVYLLEIREGLKGDEIVVSRASNGLVEGLFKREVPEIAQGTVEIKAIAREPGNRSKIAVYSSQQGIDPVGSCVGQKGVRVQAVIQELGGIEKIDIIQWQQDVKQYIAQALSPAKNVTVELNEDEKTAQVTVPQEELPLAIGREGQNVRLAMKLTGYKIDILPSEQPEELAEESQEAGSKNQGEEETTTLAEEVHTKENSDQPSAVSGLGDKEEAQGTHAEETAASSDQGSAVSDQGEDTEEKLGEIASSPTAPRNDQETDSTSEKEGEEVEVQTQESEGTSGAKVNQSEDVSASSANNEESQDIAAGSSSSGNDKSGSEESDTAQKADPSAGPEQEESA